MGTLLATLSFVFVLSVTSSVGAIHSFDELPGYYESAFSLENGKVVKVQVSVLAAVSHTAKPADDFSYRIHITVKSTSPVWFFWEAIDPYLRNVAIFQTQSDEFAAGSYVSRLRFETFSLEPPLISSFTFCYSDDPANVRKHDGRRACAKLDAYHPLSQ